MSGSVLQSGVVTPGNLAAWDGNGIVLDSGVSIQAGVGSPSGVVSANKGNLYVDTTGGVGSTLYLCQGGTVWNAIG